MRARWRLLTWRAALALAMLRAGWGPRNAHFALTGEYDDPYFTDDPEAPPCAREVMAEECSYG